MEGWAYSKNPSVAADVLLPGLRRASTSQFPVSKTGYVQQDIPCQETFEGNFLSKVASYEFSQVFATSGIGRAHNGVLLDAYYHRFAKMNGFTTNCGKEGNSLASSIH